MASKLALHGIGGVRLHGILGRIGGCVQCICQAFDLHEPSTPAQNTGKIHRTFHFIARGGVCVQAGQANQPNTGFRSLPKLSYRGAPSSALYVFRRNRQRLHIISGIVRNGRFLGGAPTTSLALQAVRIAAENGMSITVKVVNAKVNPTASSVMDLPVS